MKTMLIVGFENLQVMILLVLAMLMVMVEASEVELMNWSLHSIHSKYYSTIMIIELIIITILIIIFDDYFQFPQNGDDWEKLPMTLRVSSNFLTVLVLSMKARANFATSFQWLFFINVRNTSHSSSYCC